VSGEGSGKRSVARTERTEESRQLLRSLVLGVAHLAGCTRALAESERRGPVAFSPVRESAAMVLLTLTALEDLDAREAESARASARVVEESWLFDEGGA
jgi:hypothetical protein